MKVTDLTGLLSCIGMQYNTKTVLILYDYRQSFPITEELCSTLELVVGLQNICHLLVDFRTKDWAFSETSNADVTTDGN